MTNCKDFCDQLSDYLDREISENECTLIEEHLKVCPPCALFYKSLEISVNACRMGLSADIPDDVREGLKQFLREHCKQNHS
jgi:predicted anti-sigma-YlaC factor YlaD